MNKWKIIAIIFITLFVLETSVIVWMVYSGIELQENDYKCAYEICENYESYNYDFYTDICYCIQDGEVRSVSKTS